MVWHKGPGEAIFSKVAETFQPGEYISLGLPAGQHAYQVVGRNSRGDGPASDVAALQVVAAAAV